MANIDQRGFDNPPPDFLTGAQAARFLGVKRETLYAYASRGLVRSIAGRHGRARQYPRADLERLKARRDARAGHGPVAAGALRWGEPVLASAITAIDAAGPRYRGRSAVALATEGVRFEAVCELLWTGARPDDPPRWTTPDDFGVSLGRLAPLLPSDGAPHATLAIAVAALGARDPSRFGAPHDAELARSRRLLVRLAALLAMPRDPKRAREALHAGSVAQTLARAIGARTSADAVRALDTALVLCADHELNPSSFAARVAASVGADLYACVGAGIATLSGPRHGAACDRVEALTAEMGRPERAQAFVDERLRRGDEVPGFGHPLYPGGDPRAPPMLALARRLGARDRRVACALALVAAMRATGREPPTIDASLVAVAAAIGARPGSAAAIFAIGRIAGLVAHALEQRGAGFLMRPRARYVGP